jgi:hypothetical protein
MLDVFVIGYRRYASRWIVSCVCRTDRSIDLDQVRIKSFCVGSDPEGACVVAVVAKICARRRANRVVLL